MPSRSSRLAAPTSDIEIPGSRCAGGDHVHGARRASDCRRTRTFFAADRSRVWASQAWGGKAARLVGGRYKRICPRMGWQGIVGTWACDTVLEGVSGFESLMRSRSAAVYADFLLPHLVDGFRVLDVGCGQGAITVGLATTLEAGHVLGVDAKDEFGAAREFATNQGIRNVEFRVGDVYDLSFPTNHFDACLCHSMLETLDRPLGGLREIRRVLRPGGVVGVACVEYGGLILAGGADVSLLRRFYAIRERLWQLDGHADPYRGRELRGLLARAGFNAIEATSKYLCYGTPEAVRSFGADRAGDCGDTWYRRDAIKHRLAVEADLDEMRQAWLEWSTAPDAYAAFAWCRALGSKPE